MCLAAGRAGQQGVLKINPPPKLLQGPNRERTLEIRQCGHLRWQRNSPILGNAVAKEVNGDPAELALGRIDD